MKCKDDSDNDITYFYDTRLSYDGSYLVAGDSMNRYIFDVHGKFLRRWDGKNLYTIYQFSKTEFVGAKNSDETYTKTHLVAIDFMTDKERVLYQFDSYISTIYLSPDSSGFCFDKYPKVKLHH